MPPKDARKNRSGPVGKSRSSADSLSVAGRAVSGTFSPSGPPDAVGQMPAVPAIAPLPITPAPGPRRLPAAHKPMPQVQVQVQQVQVPQVQLPPAAAGRRRRQPRRTATAPAAGRSPREIAAVRLQAWVRGWVGRRVARRDAMFAEQQRLEEQFEREERAVAAKRIEAQEAAKEQAEKRKKDKADEKLKSLRERRCTVEAMCQSLPCQEMPWEEDPAELLKLLESLPQAPYNAWFGHQASRRTARKRYLTLARRWHPDKWAMQGDHCTAVATEVTKCLVKAYEKAAKDLPADVDEWANCEDSDEDREVNEFASWVGISFVGMKEVWKERRGVTVGKR